MTRPTDITCPKWEPPTAGTKVCRYYLKPDTNHDDQVLEKQGPTTAGLCALPTEMLCVEWVRRKGTPEQRQALRVLPPAELPKDAPGTALKPRRARFQTPFGTADVALPDGFKPAKEIDPLRLEEIERAGIEIEMAVPYLPEGRALTLVPTRTGRTDRDEITYREAATLRLLVDAFPGAHVVGWTAAPVGPARMTNGHAATASAALAINGTNSIHNDHHDEGDPLT
jgi:hypothetical protein